MQIYLYKLWKGLFVFIQVNSQNIFVCPWVLGQFQRAVTLRYYCLVVIVISEPIAICIIRSFFPAYIYHVFLRWYNLPFLYWGPSGALLLSHCCEQPRADGVTSRPPALFLQRDTGSPLPLAKLVIPSTLWFWAVGYFCKDVSLYPQFNFLSGVDTTDKFWDL